MSLPHRIARDAEVIAPIGVALALVRDVVERTILAPTPQEIAGIRREAADRVIAAGAAPDRVEVSVEIDTQRNRVTRDGLGRDGARRVGGRHRLRRFRTPRRGRNASLNCEPEALDERCG